MNQKITNSSLGLNKLATRVHSANKHWWTDQEGKYIERNKGEAFMLMVSEISEAMEGARKGITDNHLPHRMMEEVELVDCIIRILDYAGYHNLDLDSILEEKMAYNAARADHKFAARLQPGGKKW